MTQPIKKLNFDDETLDVLNGMDIRQNNGKWLGVLTCGQLERQLYAKVNKALEALGGKWNRQDGGHIFPRDPREQLGGLLDNGILTIVRDGYFPTPREIVERMLELLPLGRYSQLVLEPSAGMGAILDVLLDQPESKHHSFKAIEKDTKRREHLRSKYAGNVDIVGGDFLEYELPRYSDGVIQYHYDRIYANPPFENKQDIDHVRHAYDVLSSVGAMVAIMSEGTFFGTDSKREQFRDWLDKIPHDIIRLPEGAFNESGTGVRARLVIIWK